MAIPEEQKQAIIDLEGELLELIKKYMGTMDPQNMVGVFANATESARVRMMLIKIRQLGPGAFGVGDR